MSFKFGMMLLVLLYITGYCAAAPCVDNHDECQSWAQNDQCRVNPYTVMRTCPKACGVCNIDCDDHRNDCFSLWRDNHCQSNPESTIKDCPVMCGACEGRPF